MRKRLHKEGNEVIHVELMDMNKPDLTVKEVAAELGLVENTVRRLLSSGAMPGYRADQKSWRVTREQLDGFKAAGGVKRQGRPRKEGNGEYGKT